MPTLLAPANLGSTKTAQANPRPADSARGGILLVAGRCNVTYRYSLHPSNKMHVGRNPAFKTSKTKREKVFIETYVTDHGFHRNISIADKQCRHVWAWLGLGLSPCM